MAVARLLGRLALTAAALVAAASVLPNALGFTTLVVRTGSMGEAAPVGSMVIGRAIDVDAVRAGDVVLLRMDEQDGRPRTPVLHRVVRLTRVDGEVVVTTKGDANETADPQSHILRGSTITPVRVVPWMGFALGTITTRAGWTIFVLVPGAFLSVRTLRRLLDTSSAGRRIDGGLREPASVT